MKILLPLYVVIIRLCLFAVPIHAISFFSNNDNKEKIITCKLIETVGKLNLIAKTSLNTNEKLFIIDLSSPFTYQTQTTNNQLLPHDITYIEYNSQQYISVNNDKLNLYSCLSSLDNSTNIEIPYYKSLYLHNAPSNKTVLSLAYKPFNNDKQYSIIDMLYTKQLISYKQFLLTFTQDKGYHIIIGKPLFPSITERYKYNAKCKVVPMQTEWSCKLNAIYIKGFNMHRESIITDIYNSTSLTRVTIQTNTSNINVPLYYFNYLKQKLFKHYIERNICKEGTFNDLHIISCECRALSDFPGLVFIVDGIEIEYTKAELFEEPGTYSLFRIKSYTDKSSTTNSNSIILGTSLLKKYSLLFNYADTSITFLSNTSPFPINPNYIPSPYIRYIKYIYISITLITLLNIIYLYMINKYK